jgi:oligoribonuclease NrnB/cAMP/cGMP phosphodiesterase (DHH superfamily)
MREIEWEEKEWEKDERKKFQCVEEFENDNFKFKSYLFISPNSNNEYVGKMNIFVYMNDELFFREKELLSGSEIDELKKSLEYFHEREMNRFINKFKRFELDFDEFKEEVVDNG